MSPTQLLTLTFSHWMSQLSVNYRATWRPPPHDRKSIMAGGRGEAALFHFFCPERGLQKGENYSQEIKTVGKQITKRSESYSILRRKCSYVASRLQTNTTTLLLSSSISCRTGRSLLNGARTARGSYIRNRLERKKKKVSL